MQKFFKLGHIIRFASDFWGCKESENKKLSEDLSIFCLQEKFEINLDKLAVLDV